MRVKTALTLTLILGLGTTHSSGQTADTATGIFSGAFKSLQTYTEGNILSPPIIDLGGNSRVKVEFDEMAEDSRYLRYRLIHCNADWSPSALVETEFTDGFNQADVTDWALSESTLAHYVHYSLTIPDDQMTPTVSGNYLLQIFDQDNPDEVLLQTRFMVSENIADISSAVTSRTDVDYNQRHQQLSVTADLENAGVDDPFNDLTLIISQNGRTDNTATLRKPLRIGAKKAFYEHQPELIFPAGNEYRRIEMVTVHFPGRGIDHYEYAEPYYHAILSPDTPRPGARYEYDQDQSGRFVIHEFNADESSVQADYVVTHFALEMPEMTDREVWLDGDFVQRRFDPDSRMVYSNSRGAYVKTLLLKQGLYNYQYLVTDRLDPKKSATATIEGDHYETVNEYLILLYHRPYGARADRLIGATSIFSGK
ncbi:MAG: DUF5103 domain-containing protein [Muribaculaceae bacterium]|nr:DUF5103 domain-containing protein [Muribaculaceae bacterium]